MRRREKAELIGQVLDELYPDPVVPLSHTDPYPLLVAVVLSAPAMSAAIEEPSASSSAAGPPAGSM